VENGGSGGRAAFLSERFLIIMRIDINLATQPYEDSRNFWAYWGTGLAFLSLVTLLLGYMAIAGFVQASRERAKISALQAQITAYDQERSRAEATLSQPQNRVVRDQSRFLNDLFQRKAFSWTKVFEDLERVMPAHLHVVSIHPGMSKDNDLEIKLVVAGESREQALDLVRKMEGSKRFKGTRIDTERTETQPVNGDRVRFDVSALYIPSAPGAEGSGGMN
jgi:type IV pilus assembly protein PilN